MSIKSWFRNNSDDSLLFLFCTFITRFCTLLCCCFTISCFMGDVNARQQFSIFFCLNLDTVLKNQLQKNSATLDKLNETEWELWSLGQSEFNFQVTFSLPLPSWLLKHLCYYLWTVGQMNYDKRRGCGLYRLHFLLFRRVILGSESRRYLHFSNYPFSPFAICTITITGFCLLYLLSSIKIEALYLKETECRKKPM